MAMHLAEVPVYIIMIMGKWLLDAFLQYIRNKIAQFIQNITKRMYTTTRFIHVPALEIVIPLDPQTRNHLHNAQTGSNLGGGQSAHRNHVPLMAMW